MFYTITTIDWEELAQRYNARHMRSVSFKGSNASLVKFENEITLHIDLQLFDKTTNDTRRPIDSNNNHFELSYVDGKLSYQRVRVDIHPPPNAQSITVGKIPLYNILPDYIEVFLTSLEKK
jgi:hypothetical protein